ncbi:MAG: hypothetical protein LBP89_05130 [Helicobacteraceae bacterium]|jgi:hypothetical protein|nr:hypothetical protein [Helicobacteraceae bacterium]
MILAYDFIYVSPNAVLENYLYLIASQAKQEFYIKKQNKKITLFVRGEEEALKTFSDRLAAEAPLSIFLRGVTARIAENWNIEESSAIKACFAPLGFSPRSLIAAKKSGDWTIKPEIGAAKALENMPPIDSAVESLSGGGAIEISGSYRLFALENRAYNPNAVIMPTDIGYISEIAIAKTEDINALGSIERSILRLPTNLIFQSKYPALPRLIGIALAGDLYLYLLSLKLAEKGVKAIVLEDYDHIEVVALETQNLIASGLGFSPSLDRFFTIKEPYFRAFGAAIDERDLRGEANLGFFLSVENDDRFMFNAPKTGAIELLKIDLPTSIADIFAAIEQSGESGAKLISNYREKYGDIIGAIESATFENAPKNVASLWALAGLILGFDLDIKSAFNKTLEYIAFCAMPKSPIIDYKLNNNAIDPLPFFRSAISYKLAGTPDELIAYGMCESLIYFLSDLVDIIVSKSVAGASLIKTRNADRFLAALNIETPENIFLLGSLFSCKALSQLALKHIAPNRKLYFPNALPLEF